MTSTYNYNRPNTFESRYLQLSPIPDDLLEHKSEDPEELSIGVCTFGFGKKFNLLELVNQWEKYDSGDLYACGLGETDEGSGKSRVWSEELGQKYLEFFLSNVEQRAIQNDIVVCNEYSYPSFFMVSKDKKTQDHRAIEKPTSPRGERELKRNEAGDRDVPHNLSHEKISNEMQKIANKHKCVLIPGTANICDQLELDATDRVKDNGYHLGYVYFPQNELSEQAIQGVDVGNRALQQRKKYFKYQHSHRAGEIVEGFSKFSTEPKLFAFETSAWCLGVSICADFIARQEGGYPVDPFELFDRKGFRPEVNAANPFLLFVPAKDSSRKVMERAQEVAPRVHYNILVANSLDESRYLHDAIGLFECKKQLTQLDNVDQIESYAQILPKMPENMRLESWSYDGPRQDGRNHLEEIESEQKLAVGIAPAVVENDYLKNLFESGFMCYSGDYKTKFRGPVSDRFRESIEVEKRRYNTGVGKLQSDKNGGEAKQRDISYR